jgi:DNA repair exonuclease SbcCD ATPase subunit/DNA repair exonuclease SbcCD nuclease subunit
MKVIPTDFDKLEKIIHLADIHIRLYKRHAEYRFTFENLYRQLEKYKNTNTAIVVAGDILHSKTDLSPEMVQLASEFLNSLANIAPTIIIAGNHDFNMSNINRLDSLSPIVNNLKNSNLHYLRNSGVYRFADVDFAVMSILDDRVDWPTSSDCTASTKIALFHGPVHNAQTDVGYVVSSRSVSVDDFDGFDIVLLGDIHRHQYLKTENPVVAYPGSLIQQNHGETLENHGYIEWEVTSRTPSFNEVENDYGYLTIRTTDGKIPTLNKIPKNVRVRLFTANLDTSGIKKLTALIRKQMNVVELTVNRIPDSTTISSSSTASTENIHDVQYQNALISDYILLNYPNTSQEILERIFEINKQLNAKLVEDDLPRSVVWRPLRLKFDNLFSYGEGNEINFSDMKGLYGVFSPNATGKTSAFDSLCFALYDKTPRAFKGSHIMNTRANYCYCEFDFEIHNVQYKIIRKGERKKNGEVKVDVDFMRLEEDGSYTTLNGEDRRHTNHIIRSYVGSYDDFILTNLSVQNQNSLFIDKGQSDRKDLLSQFLGLTIFDRLYDLASTEVKELTGALKRFNKDDFTQELVDVQNSIDSLNIELQDQELKQINLHKVINDLNELISQKYEKKIPIDDVLESVNPSKINDLITETDKKIEAYQKSLLENSNIKQSYLDKIKEMERSIIEIDPSTREELKYQIQQHTKIDQDITRKKHKIKELEHKIESLQYHEYDPNCKYCVNNIFVKDAEKARLDLPAAELELQKLLDYKSSLWTQQKIEKITNQLESNENLTSSILSAKNKISDIESTIKKIENSIQSSILTKQKSVELLDRYNKAIEDVKINNELNNEISLLKSEKMKFETQHKSLLTNIRSLEGKLKVLQHRKDEMLSKIREAEELESVYDAYEYYMNAISRDGLPYQLISEIIPSLEGTVNNILSQLVDFQILMEIDGKNINGKIVYDDNRTWPLELASGMEKFISSLAIRIGLMKVSSLPRANFIIIDEGLGVLDSDNLSSIFMLFNMLKEEFEFLILISHLDVVRDIAENLIEIKREDGFSYIRLV